jgi:hypothetical protein
MSYPRIGNQLEVNGDFEISFDYKEQLAGFDTTSFVVQPNQESFKINNDYYSQLFDEGKICLYWSIYCKTSFLFQEYTNFEKTEIPVSKMGEVVEINYYLIANENFEFNPPEGSVNSFFSSKVNIDKGCILSVDNRKNKINLKIIDHGVKSSILNFELDVKMTDEIKVEYEQADKYIWVKIKNKEFFNGLDRMLSHKNLKPLAVNSFFGPIFIDAIRRLSNDNNQLTWMEDLKRIIEFDESNKDLYADFDYALKVYNEKLFNDGNIFFHKLIEDFNKLSE